jgi:hypothetical protein
MISIIEYLSACKKHALVFKQHKTLEFLMNLSQQLATILSTHNRGVDHPIFIFAETCNLMLPVTPIKPNEGNTQQEPQDMPRIGGENGISPDDGQKNEIVTESEVPNLQLSTSVPQIAPILRQHFNDDGAMTTKQVFDSLINSGEYATLENHFGDEIKKKIQTALAQMKADGYLTRANGKMDTPYVPTERIYNLFKKSDAQESNTVETY